ncbi:MAG TPA: sigma factor-like helix-turn-helix DNA-binding protein [Solirubrobacteraceae bacterium]|nr:sigma factor-like helix-turn-helix DNA-binding protein [Solirubrobacteraceae bacterium]
MLREQGKSLDEIALGFGVSRERVRQILHEHGTPDPRKVAAARRRRVEQEVEAQLPALLALWRAGAAAGSAAEALGLQVTACRNAIARAATDADRDARRLSLAGDRAIAKTYSDQDILTAVTSVAQRLGRVPTAKEYGAQARELELPSLPTVVNRMGRWTNAIRGAGLVPAHTAAHARARRWTAESCWHAIRVVVAELGEIPTVVAYDRHAAGRRDLPSSATLRNRLGRWSQITGRLIGERDAPYTDAA